MLKIDYKFKDESLLRLAMTHSSYANEHHGTHLQCNERLEFLGDSVLGFVTAGYLFTHYPDLPEGDLTKLRAAVVCEGALDEIAHEIGIPEAIRLGHGEEMGGGRKRASILADATEALLGAIFMDGGIEPAVRSCCALSRIRSRLRWQAARSRTTRPCCRRSCRRTSRKRWNIVWQGSPARTTTSGSPWSCCSTPMCLPRASARAKRKPSRWRRRRLWKIWDADAYRQTAIEINGKEVEKSTSFFCMTQLVVEKILPQW